MLCIWSSVIFTFWVIDPEHSTFPQLCLSLHLVGLVYKNCCLKPKINVMLGSPSAAELNCSLALIESHQDLLAQMLSVLFRSVLFFLL